MGASSRVRIPEGKHFCLLRAELRAAASAGETASACRGRLARAGQLRRVPRPGRADDHAHRADRPAHDAHLRPDVSARSFALGLQSNKRPGTYAGLARQAEADGFDVVSVFNDLLFQPPSRPCSRSRRRRSASRREPTVLSSARRTGSTSAAGSNCSDHGSSRGCVRQPVHLAGRARAATTRGRQRRAAPRRA